MLTPVSFSDREDFKTHLKYADLLAKMSSNITATCQLTPPAGIIDLKQLKSKNQLIELTKKSIDDELEIVEIDKAYSKSAVLWLPIKTYYLVYHQLCVIHYLLTGEVASLRKSHNTCAPAFTKMLLIETLAFSNPLLNQVRDRSILEFKTDAGEHFRSSSADDRIYNLVLKYVIKEQISNEKTKKGLDERNRDDKDKMDTFREKLSVSIFDFLYLMRLRLNYRNGDFIDDVPASSTKLYFQKYQTIGSNFYLCLRQLQEDLISRLPS